MPTDRIRTILRATRSDGVGSPGLMAAVALAFVCALLLSPEMSPFSRLQAMRSVAVMAEPPPPLPIRP